MEQHQSQIASGHGLPRCERQSSGLHPQLLQLVRLPPRLRRTGLRHAGYRHCRCCVFIGGDGQQLQYWLVDQFLLEPMHHAVDLRLRQPDLQALLQLALRPALGQCRRHCLTQLSHHCWRDLEGTVRTPFARHAGSDSLSRYVLGDAANGIDM